MRILFFNEVAARVGGEMNHYVMDVASRLREAGDTVALVHGREPKTEFRGTGYIFDHLRKFNAPEEEVRVRLEAIVDDFRPDIIQIHGVPNLPLDAWLTARAPTVRWVHNHFYYCSGRGMTLSWPRIPCSCHHGPNCLASHYVRRCGSANPLKNLLRYRAVSAALGLLKKSQGIQVASRMLGENLARNGVDPARITHLPLYAPAPDTKKAPVPKRRMILHAGGLVPHKGVWLMVQNIESLPDDVDVVFAGAGGPLEKPLERFVARNGLSERVRIVGNVKLSQWSMLFQQATLVVMPSLWNEPLGLAGIYAMAHGKPVVAFRNSGIEEWLEHEVTGIAVPFGQRETFIGEVSSLLNDWKRSQKIGAVARERWEEQFQPARHLERLREYYQSMAR